MSSKVLVITGINGFIGGNISLHFENELHYNIIGIEQKRNLFQRGKASYYSWEELDLITRGDCIIHLAGLAHDTTKSRLSQEYFRVNTDLTKTIFDYFLKSKAEMFLFFSTVKAAADYSDIPLNESTCPNPTTIYGQSKFLAEQYILNNLPKEGRKVYILRPFMIHGPQPKGNLLSLYKYFQKGLPYPFGSMSNNRSYLSIGNLNYILTKLIESDIPSGIYHLADDEPLSTKRIIELIGESLKIKLRIINLPLNILKSFASLGNLLHLPINSGMIQKLTGNFIVSNEKIKKALDINRLPISSEEGMRITFKNIN